MSEDNYKFLYEVSRKSLDEEIDRYKRLDEKAGRFINVSGICFVAYSAVVKEASENISSNPQGTLYWLFIISAFTAFSAILISFARLISAVKLLPAQRIKIGTETVSVIENESLITCHFKLAEQCQEIVEDSRKVLMEKERAIKLATDEILFFVFMLSVSMALLFFIEMKIGV